MWYKKAVSYNNQIAKLDYLMSKYNTTAYKDIIKYAPYLLMAADSGEQKAQYMLGDLFLSHNNKDNKDNAFMWFARAANQGNANAMALLAFCYEKGYGAEESIIEAQKWYDRVIALGGEMIEVARQGLNRIKMKRENNGYSNIEEGFRVSRQSISFFERYYISGRRNSVLGMDLIAQELPKGTLVRKMLSDEWIPIDMIDIPMTHISDTSYYYAWGMKGVYRMAELENMYLPKTHLIREVLTDQWFPIGII